MLRLVLLLLDFLPSPVVGSAVSPCFSALFRPVSAPGPSASVAILVVSVVNLPYSDLLLPALVVSSAPPLTVVVPLVAVADPVLIGSVPLLVSSVPSPVVSFPLLFAVVPVVFPSPVVPVLLAGPGFRSLGLYVLLRLRRAWSRRTVWSLR